MFPELQSTLNKKAFLLENRMNAEAIKSTMKWTREFFEGSDVEKGLTQFLTRNLSPQKMPCKKIVAFGGYSMSLARYEKQCGSYYRDWDPLRWQNEHAAVMSIHNTLERIYNTKLPVFLQDLNYTEEDKRAASQFEKPMNIVNGHFGFQEGWVEIDESTFFIDLSTPKTNVDGFYRQIFEFTRPAAIFSVFHYRSRPERDWRKAPFVFHLQQAVGVTVTNKTKKGPKVDYPGLGM